MNELPIPPPSEPLTDHHYRVLQTCTNRGGDPAYCIDIAKDTGLTPQTVNVILQQLAHRTYTATTGPKPRQWLATRTGIRKCNRERKLRAIRRAKPPTKATGDN